MKPTRQRDWRWAVVAELYDKGRPPPGKLAKDEYLVEMHCFWRDFQELSEFEDIGLVDSILIEEKYPEAFFAHDLYVKSSLERYFVEALIMSRATAKVIAEKLGVDEKHIIFYEKTFLMYGRT